MSKVDLDIEEVCNSITNYQTNDMFTELILNYFLDIYDVIEESKIHELRGESLKKESLQVFERTISKRFNVIQGKVSEKLRGVVETELVKRVNGFFKDYFKVSDISNEIWNELVDVASDLYLDFYTRCVKV